MASTPYLQCDLRLLQGAVKDISILVWDSADPTTDLSAATAVMAVYDEDDNVILASGACSITGTTQIACTRSFDSSAANGKMRAVVVVTFGTQQEIFQLSFQVDDNPGPQ